VIRGTIQGGDHQLVTLERMGASVFEPVDSVRCDRNGQFSLSFTQSSFDYYALKYAEQGYVTLALFPGEKIHLTGTDSSVHPYSIEGSEASEQIRELALEHKRVLEELERIGRSSQAIADARNFVERKENLNRQFDSITTSFNRYSRNFIEQHAGSPATLIALYSLYGPGLPVFDPRTDLEIYQFVDSTLFGRFSQNEAVRSFHSQLQTTLQQLRNQRKEHRLQPGMKAPDFVARDAEGNTLALRDLRGSWVLIHYWASWSKPSMDEQPYIQSCYATFVKKGLSIVQVSLDDREDQWLDAAETGRPGWYHVCDLMRWESPLVTLYQVERIPANFLINPEGIIMEKDIFGDDLLKTIQLHL
jgi:hypothetical protein